MKCIKTLRGHTDWLWSVAFCPDGKTIATSSDDHTIRLWNARNYEFLRILKGHADCVLSVDFHPNGKILSSRGGDKTIKIRDIATGKCIKTLQGHTNWMWADPLQAILHAPGQSLPRGDSRRRETAAAKMRRKMCIRGESMACLALGNLPMTSTSSYPARRHNRMMLFQMGLERVFICSSLWS